MKTRAIALIPLLLLAGCTLRLISEYDAETDKGVNELQADVTAHFAKLDRLAMGPNGQPVSPQCKFENFADVYSQFAAKAHVLKVRNEVRDKNEITTKQLELLEQNLGELLPTVHREAAGGCMNHGTIIASRETMDQMFRAILKLEIGKKTFRGGK